MKSLPTTAGTYAVVMQLHEPTHFSNVGRQIHDLELPRGFYVYIGSAFGGLKGRIENHIRYAVNLHWNVDYLRPAVVVHEVWFTADLARRECLWAQEVFFRVLRGHPPARYLAPGTAASYPPRFGALPTSLLFRRHRHGVRSSGRFAPSLDMLPLTVFS